MNPLLAQVTSSSATSYSAEEMSVLLNDIKQRALLGEFDHQRMISRDIIERLREAGIYRALVPKQFGGSQCSPAEFCQLIECISEYDGSTGWVASFGMSPVYLASLPLETIKALYAQQKGADTIFAAGLFPFQPATRVSGGLKINGRWKYSSGSPGADIIGVGIQPVTQDAKELPLIAVLPRDQVSIDPTWETTGLLGTGSNDIVVQDIIVPEAWTFIRGGQPNLDEPLFRYPSIAFATQVLSVVGLGIARRAINEVRQIAEANSSVTGAPSMSKRPVALTEIAKAEARLRSARSFFYEAINDVWETILKGDALSTDQKNLLRLSCTHGVREAAEICRSMQLIMGMGGVAQSSAVARCVNDSFVVTQHAFMGDVTLQNAGSVFCGQTPLPGYI